LMCAGCFQVAVSNASVHALSEGGDGPGDETQKELKSITLNLQIGKKGFVLSAQGDQSPEELLRIAGTIPKKQGKYDFEKLAERCKKIHDKYNKSDTVVILPEKDVLYDVIVQTMDAARERILDKRLDTREHLFTNAVVSSIL